MDKNENLYRWLSIFLGAGVIIAAVAGIFYSYGGERFTITGLYGNTVEMYGDGLYAYNSVLTVANRLGSDVIGILLGMALIIIMLWRKKSLFLEILRTSITVCLTYYLAFLVLEIALNSLYFLYVICFSTALFMALIRVKHLMKSMVVTETLKAKRLTGTGIFLISVGVIVAVLWGSNIISAMLHNSYGTLLEDKATEITYGLDLTITCPIFIMCGVWLLKKRDIGYKVAPILLNIMVGIALLVISQRMYCAKLGINIPIGALIGFIISFIIMGIISLVLVFRLMNRMKKADTGLNLGK